MRPLHYIESHSENNTKRSYLMSKDTMKHCNHELRLLKGWIRHAKGKSFFFFFTKGMSNLMSNNLPFILSFHTTALAPLFVLCFYWLLTDRRNTGSWHIAYFPIILCLFTQTCITKLSKPSKANFKSNSRKLKWENTKTLLSFLRAVCHQMPKAGTIVTQPIPPETKVAETIVKGIIRFTGSIPIDRYLAGTERVHDGHVDQTKSDIECFFEQGRCYIEIIQDLQSCCFFAFIILYISTISCYAHIVDYTSKWVVCFVWVSFCFIITLLSNRTTFLGTFRDISLFVNDR